MLVQSTDAIALVQRGVARQFAKTTNIRILEPPFEIPEVTMCAYWAAIHEADPPHVWFRTLLQEVLRAGHGSSGRMNADNE